MVLYPNFTVCLYKMCCEIVNYKRTSGGIAVD